MNNKIKEMPICVNCIHAYVCEEYNLNRDMLRKRCAYHNDHFLDIEQHENKGKETARDILKDIIALFPKDKQFTTISRATIYELAKQYGVEIKE